MIMRGKISIAVALSSIVVMFAGGCAPAGSSLTPAVTYSTSELKYRLIANFGGVFYVDPDFYPVAREGQEQANALQQFADIRADEAEFSAIRQHLGMADKSEYTSEEKVLIYREHKKLSRGVELVPSGDAYSFVIRVGEGKGERIEGTVTPSGRITVLKREPSFNTYPICLAAGTLIDTPGGPVPVERLAEGMTVWTVDGSGNRAAAAVQVTHSTPVPPFSRLVRVTLNDGRAVTASPGHPAADGRPLRDYRAGDTMDGALVVAVEHVTYGGYATYDLLPSGPTGLYWANSVLLRSTLTRRFEQVLHPLE